jgi:uncharacterized protein YegL
MEKIKEEQTEVEIPMIEIISVLDRSGSMETIQTEAIGTYNTFLKEQREMPGAVKLTTILFDDHYDVLYEQEPLESVPDLDNQTFVPRGMTALYDAVGKTIQTVSERLAKTKEDDQPAKVIMVILTDGEENASKEYTGTKISALIKAKQEQDWEFIYLASDLNQFRDEAFAHVGISMKFEASTSKSMARSIGNKGADGVDHFVNSNVRIARMMGVEQFEEKKRKARENK